MRKVDLTDYTVYRDVNGKSGAERIPLPYYMKTSLLNLLFVPNLKLAGAALIRNNVLAMKIESCEKESILLEEEEWGRLKTATDVHDGFGRDDVEMVRRIQEAEEVEV
jgi:hypothetical protein